jgi:hypothetical protein
LKEQPTTAMVFRSARAERTCHGPLVLAGSAPSLAGGGRWSNASARLLCCCALALLFCGGCSSPAAQSDSLPAADIALADEPLPRPDAVSDDVTDLVDLGPFADDLSTGSDLNQPPDLQADEQDHGDAHPADHIGETLPNEDATGSDIIPGDVPVLDAPVDLGTQDLLAEDPGFQDMGTDTVFEDTFEQTGPVEDVSVSDETGNDGGYVTPDAAAEAYPADVEVEESDPVDAEDDLTDWSWPLPDLEDGGETEDGTIGTLPDAGLPDEGTGVPDAGTTPDAGTPEAAADTPTDPVDGDPYEPNDSSETAFPLGELGPEGYDSLPGTTIDPGYDKDWFSFSSLAGGILHVRLVPQADQNMVILLRDSFGNLLWYADSGQNGKEENLYYAMLPGSHLKVQFKSWYGKGGNYTFRLSLDPPEASETSCVDKLDNDVDGLVDCSDPDCASDTLCEGETCLTAHPVNGGKPIQEADSGSSLSYQGTTTGYANDYSGECGAGFAPDAVWTFTLEELTEVSVTLKFLGWISSSAVLYIRQGSCDGPVVGCKASKFSPAEIKAELGPGTYYVFVDRAGLGFGDYLLTFKFEDVVTGDDCTNGIDEDKDGLIDCQDPDCNDSPYCQGAWCENALPVNMGIPIGKADDGLALQYTGSTTGLYDAYKGSCAGGPLPSGQEAVWKLVLADPMLVSVAHSFDDFTKQPLLYLRGFDCSPSGELACDGNNPAVISSLLLPAGTYFLFVDAEHPEESGEYLLQMHFAAPPQ